MRNITISFIILICFNLIFISIFKYYFLLNIILLYILNRITYKHKNNNQYEKKFEKTKITRILNENADDLELNTCKLL